MQMLFRRNTRTLVAAGMMVIVFFLAAPWLDLDSGVLLAWDVGIFWWLVVTFAMMAHTNAQQTSVRAQGFEPNASSMLVVVTATAIVGFLGSVVLASRSGGRAPLEQSMHFAIGVVAIGEAWLLVHTQFALFYAELYYDEVPSSTTQADQGTIGPFRKGLEFPDAEVVDYWDFIYYSYTIAMCYQTSDVTITAPRMRRVTIVHALISFAFVAVLIAFIVNAISNIL
jgi:uncharacterized membrane protein